MERAVRAPLRQSRCAPPLANQQAAAQKQAPRSLALTHKRELRLEAVCSWGAVNSGEPAERVGQRGRLKQLTVRKKLQRQAAGVELRCESGRGAALV